MRKWICQSSILLLLLVQCRQPPYLPKAVSIPDWGYYVQLLETNDSCCLKIRDMDSESESTATLQWIKKPSGYNVNLFILDEHTWIIDRGPTIRRDEIHFSSNFIHAEWNERTPLQAFNLQMGENYFESNNPLVINDIQYASMLRIWHNRLEYKPSPRELPSVLYEGTRFDRTQRAHFKTPRNVAFLVDEKAYLSIELKVDLDYAYIITHDTRNGELRDSIKTWTWMKLRGSVFRGIPIRMPTIVDHSLWLRFDKDTTFIARAATIAAEQYGPSALTCLKGFDALDQIEDFEGPDNETLCLIEIRDNHINLIRHEQSITNDW